MTCFVFIFIVDCFSFDVDFCSSSSYFNLNHSILKRYLIVKKKRERKKKRNSKLFGGLDDKKEKKKTERGEFFKREREREREAMMIERVLLLSFKENKNKN